MVPVPGDYLYLNVITGGLTMFSQPCNILFDWPLYLGAPEKFPCYSSGACLERVSRGVRDGTVLKRTCCCRRGLGLGSQESHGDSQPPPTPVLEKLMSSTPQAPACMENTETHSNTQMYT